MSVTCTPTSLEVLNAHQRGLRIEFHLQGDRYHHTIHGVQGNDSVPLLVSLEGSSDDTFPTSPPLSEILRQDSTLLLTGATSVAHWSMSVEPSPNEEHAQLIFDVACRVKRGPATLGNAYQTVGESILKQVDNMAFATSPLDNTACSAVVGPASLEEPANSQIKLGNRGMLQITPVSKPTDAFPATIQWQYAIALGS